MKRSTFRGFATVVALLLGAGLAFAEEEEDQTPQPRSFSRFEFDTGTVDGLYVETGVAHFQEQERDRSQTLLETLTMTVPFARIAAGGADMFEGGVLIPYGLYSFEREVPDPDSTDFGLMDALDDQERGLGDIRAYAKVVPLRTEMLDLGAGLNVGFPTGDHDEGPGMGRLRPRTTSPLLAPSGEFEFLPYATGAVRSGSLELRAHGGYLWPVDETSTAFETAIYGGGLYYIYHDRLTLRAEFVGASPTLPGPDVDLVTFEPGFDLYIPIGGVSFRVRPVGMIGMTEESPDWGVGGSIAVNLTPANLGY